MPGVVYGQGGEARPFQVADRELRVILIEGQTLLDLEIDGSKAGAGGDQGAAAPPGPRATSMHMDCLEVRLDEEIQSEVPIELEGTEQAPGVKEGGVLEHVTRELTVEALPTEIPEKLTADVSEMVIGDTIQLSRADPALRRQVHGR